MRLSLAHVSGKLSSSTAVASIGLLLVSWISPAWGMSSERRIELREEVRTMFKHGFDGYMQHAYPADELKPLSCGPSRRDPDPANVGINDVHANISMTLLDTLSTLPMLYPEVYEESMEKIATEMSFDQDFKVQVFEMTIRALGGLLSTYQHLETLPLDPTEQAAALGLRGSVDVKRYQDRMLQLALDLGTRLLPAFKTPTGIPYSRVNLRYGVENGESEDTCSAGAGSLILEFALLSRLTGDPRFETLAHDAFFAIWNRRSSHNLIGNTIGAKHGQWLAPGLSGVQAGMDSYYEYALKASILLGDDEYLDVFDDAYAAIQTFVRTQDGFIYRPIQFRLLKLGNPSTIDSLSAFLGGVQVTAGDLESAIKNHLVHWNLWRRYSASPESWNWLSREVHWAGWPGRPEFVESTYYLYQATRDPFYLRVGERVLQDVRARVQTSCGFATMKNVDTGELEDRMESFVLSELFKYLYLLFDPTPGAPLSNRVFSTEGQSLHVPVDLLQPPSPARRILHRGEDSFCPIYVPPVRGGLTVGIEQRADYEYARSLVFGPGVNGRAEENGDVFWSESGFCQLPRPPRWTVDIVLAPHNASSPSPPAAPDPSVSIASKVIHDAATGHFFVSDVSEVPLSVRWRFDNQGYDIASIGPHRVRPGQQVFVTDPKMEGYLPLPSPSPETVDDYLPAEVMLRFSLLHPGGNQVILHAAGGTATFGRKFGNSGPDHWGLGGGPVRLVPPEPTNPLGCPANGKLPRPPKSKKNDGDFVLLLIRGECTFFDKLVYAYQKGAVGVLVIDEPPEQMSGPIAQQAFEEGGIIRPSAESEPENLMKETEDIGMVFTTFIVGEVIKGVMDNGKQVGVELMRMEGVEVPEMQMKKDVDGRKDGTRGEGRLALGEWVIWNLRIVQAPP